MSRGFLLFILWAGFVKTQLPSVDKFEEVLMGEGQWCTGTQAIVQTQNDFTMANEEGIVSAVSSAIVEQYKKVENNPSLDSVLAAASAAAELVLEVVAQAEASVKADIVSPDVGCWAIGFGQAQAVAVANATVTAISKGFASAQQGGQQQSVDLEASTVENDIQVAVKQVALLIADGSGSGYQSKTKKAVATARATAVNCALARAFASIVDGEMQAIAFAAAGCIKPPTSPSPSTFESPFFDCDCQEQNSQGAPSLCGEWGNSGNGDQICYIRQSPGKFCPCAVDSKRYNGLQWRYCGKTLLKMQEWLLFEDDLHNITVTESAYGFCGDRNPRKDVIGN